MLFADREVIGMGDVLPPLAEQLRMLVADDVAECPVQQEEAAIEVLVDDADGGVLERAAEPRLALAQGRFGLPEFLQQGDGGRRIADDEAPLPGLVDAFSALMGRPLVAAARLISRAGPPVRR